MYKFTLAVDILYKNNTSIQQHYNLSWDSNAKTFLQHMTDIMETLSVAEEPGVLDSIDIIQIKFIDKLISDDLNQVHEFVKGTKVKCDV